MIGEGEWTVVFQARPIANANEATADYTVKVLKRGFEQDPTAIQLIQREAFVGQQVRDPHLATILSEHTDRAPRFIVLPYLDGRTVDEAITEVGRLSTPHALWIARQVAEGLCTLHASGWLHGDIKPANVLVSPNGHATLLDLGFAQRFKGNNTNRDTLATSLAYAPPEAFNPNVSFGPASDIYSLGITLFEMLTGRCPFDAAEPSDLAAAHLVKPMPDPRAWVPQVPSRVLRLLRRMLAKEPFRRPHGEELVSWLVELEVETFDQRVPA